MSLTVEAALGLPEVVALLFAEVELDVPVRAFSGIGSYTTPDGKLWTGAGALGRFSPVTTAEKIEAAGFQLGFWAAREGNEEHFGDFAAAIEADRTLDVKRKTVRGHIGVFDPASGELIGGRLEPFANGLGSRLRTSWSATGAGVTLECEPLMGAAYPAKSLFLTNEDQQGLYAGDVALEFVSTLTTGGRVGTWNPGV